MGVGQEADVERQVLLARRPVLEAEAHERERQAPRCFAGKELRSDLGAQSRRGHARGVDHHIGAAAQGGEHRTLARHACRDAALGRHRVTPARLLVAIHERLLGGLQEQELVVQAQRVEVVDDRPKRLEVDAAAHVRDHRRTLDLGALVNAEVARVLERVQRGRLARAGEAGDHDEILQVRLHERPRRLARPPIGAGAPRTQWSDHRHCLSHCAPIAGRAGVAWCAHLAYPARCRRPCNSRPTFAGTPGTA